jgi:putative ABC transport system permease protein
VKTTDLLRFASVALRGHRLRTLLSLVGVAIGVASVIILTSLGEGARLYVIGEFSSLGTNLVIVLPGKSETTGMPPAIGGAAHDLTLEDAEAVRRRVPEAVRVAPLAIGSATARVGERSREMTIVGTTSEWLAMRRMTMQLGRHLPSGAGDRDRHVCVVGSTVQAELFGGANPLGEMVRIGDERFRVIGVLAPRGESLGMNIDDHIQLPVTQALRMFNRRGLFRLLVEARSHEEMDTTRRHVLEILTERHDNVEDVTIITQDAVISTFGRILAILTAVLVGIAAISLAVAGIGIMNVMLVSVSERTREVGLLKALGASRGQVLVAFLVEAAMLSTAGGVVGLAAAFAANRALMALYPSFPVQPPRWAVALAILVSIAVGCAFGALPARRASRLDPVAALTRR